MRILSGIQPSGIGHLGNYLGAIRQWALVQSDDAFYSVVDLHSLTLDIAPEKLRHQTLDTLAVLLASGIDPDVCTVFVQSHVPYHAQLSWLLECVASYGELTRMTQFKEKSGRQEGYRVGLLTYPVLMAADILLYRAREVPVGDDQRQHLELARNVAERFNNRYGEVFTVPEAVAPPVAARVMDLQEPTRKMSKSVDSPLGTIYVLDSPEDIVRKVKKAVTDTDGEVRVDRDVKPGVTNLLEILSAFSGETPEALAARYERYGDLKSDVADAVVEGLTPLRERFVELRPQEDYLREVATRGAEKASAVAREVYDAAARAMGL